MTREVFVEKNFRRSTMVIIEQANVIIAEYDAQGFALTLRQLFYQFVARGLIKNSQGEYKRLGAIVQDTRRAGHFVLHLGDHDRIRPKTLRTQLRSVADLVDYLGAPLARLEPST